MQNNLDTTGCRFQVSVSNDDDPERRFEPDVPGAQRQPDWRIVSAFDDPDVDVDIVDSGFSSMTWGRCADEVWRKRDCFMP